MDWFGLARCSLGDAWLCFSALSSSAHGPDDAEPRDPGGAAGEAGRAGGLPLRLHGEVRHAGGTASHCWVTLLGHTGTAASHCVTVAALCGGGATPSDLFPTLLARAGCAPVPLSGDIAMSPLGKGSRTRRSHLKVVIFVVAL